MIYQPRTYRKYSKSDDLISFKVINLETDLFVSCEKDLAKEAEGCVKKAREEIGKYISRYPDFKDSLKPVSIANDAPSIIKEMAIAANLCGVGPMAAVAGAIAEAVGNHLLKFSRQVIVENGGDLFISSSKPRVIGIYAGKSKFSEKLGLEIEAGQTPCGICTSSGTIGHSLSFGKADAVIILSKSASLADAAATAICNRVRSKDDIDKAIEYGRSIRDLTGIIIIIGDVIGAWGRVKLIDM